MQTKAYWIQAKTGTIIDIGDLHHEEHAVRSGIVKQFIGEDETRLEALKNGFIRVRQYQNHWSVQCLNEKQLNTESLKQLVSQFDKHAEVIIGFIEEKSSFKTSVNKL